MRYDLAIVGGGSTGLALAALAAERGLRTILLERRPLAEAGARWVNDVPPWMFREAGIPAPEGDEVYPPSRAAHLIAGRAGPERVTLRGFDVIGVDMRLLERRLASRALEAGAALRDGVAVRGLCEHGRRLETSVGPIAAECVADCSGLAGARLLGRGLVPPTDLCAAAQEQRAIRDPARARAFFERHGAAPDEGISLLGAAGGFSTLSARLVRGELFLLAGTIPAVGVPSGGALLDAFAQEERAWVGERIFGGRRAIPLGFPAPLLARGRTARLGDAALQVFAGHGSGVGAGLVAARALADALADGRDPESYAAAWQRRWGALHASADLFRRLAQTIDDRAIGRLMRAGILSEAGMRAGAEQRWPEIALDPRILPRLVKGALIARALGARMAVLAGRTAALRVHYARYPEAGRDLPAWTRTLFRLMGVGEPAAAAA